MRFGTILWAYIFVNTAAFLLAYDIPGVGQIIPVGRELFTSPLDLTNTFSLTVFSMAAGGSIVAGVVSILLRQYVYAAGILIIAVISIFTPIVLWLLAGLPMMLSAIFAPFDFGWLTAVVVGFVTVHAFLFLAGLMAGREF